MILPEYAIPITGTAIGAGNFTVNILPPLPGSGEMPESILDEAKRVIRDRKAAYDEREQNFTRIAVVAPNARRLILRGAKRCA